MSLPTEQELQDLVDEWNAEAAEMRSAISTCEGKVPESIWNGWYGVIDSRATLLEECAEALRDLME